MEQEITLYTQPGCGPCIVFKNYLTAQKVDFTIKNVQQDNEARDRMISLGYRGTPVLEFVHGEEVRHTGGKFNPAKITEVIEGGI